MKKLMMILIMALALSLTPVNAEAASVKKPSAKSTSGVYYKSVTVKLNKKKGYKYYYTTNKKNPTNKSKKFGSKLTLKKNTTLKVIAYKGKKKSKVSTYTYKVQGNYAVPNKKVGTYTSTQKVKFSLAKGYTYKYSTDGKKFSTLKASTTISIPATKTITVKVYSGKKVKKTLKFKYTIKKSSTTNTEPTQPSTSVPEAEKPNSSSKPNNPGNSTGNVSNSGSTSSTDNNTGNNTVTSKGCVISASKVSGSYDSPITVKLSCSKGHHLNYSFDGGMWDSASSSVEIEESCTLYVWDEDTDAEAEFYYIIASNKPSTVPTPSPSNPGNTEEKPDGYNTTEYTTMNGRPVLNRYNYRAVPLDFCYIDLTEFKYIYENYSTWFSKATSLDMLDSAIREAGIPIVVNSNGVITNLNQFKDYDMVVKIYAWMSKNFVYGDPDSTKPFWGYRGKCGDLASWFSLFMGRLQVLTANTVVFEINHGWNVVMIEGKLYNVDMTHTVDRNPSSHVSWGGCLIPDCNSDLLLDDYNCTAVDHIMGAEKVITYNNLEEAEANINTLKSYNAAGRRVAIRMSISSTGSLVYLTKDIFPDAAAKICNGYEYVVIGI